MMGQRQVDQAALFYEFSLERCRRSQRHAFFAYANNYRIDLKAAVVIDVEATRAIRQAILFIRL